MTDTLTSPAAAYAMAVQAVRTMQSGALPPVDCPVDHTFTPGLYTRTIFMPAGAAIVSKIHRTRHPFVVLRGRVEVWQQETGWVEIRAPHMGITEPGTQRLLKVHEDTVWATFHPTVETDLDRIEAQIIEPFIMPEGGLETEPQPEELTL